ncbi:MAG: Zinc/iron permease, partial [Candidatus Daviesbacteria bacterium GW2011_GWA2_40_9]
MPTLLSIILASLFISLVSFVGGILLFWGKVGTQKITAYLVSFAAGTMLAVAFLDLLPEALKASTEANIFVPALLGLLTFFFLERFVVWFHHHDSPHDASPTVILILVGDGVHNFIDGVGIAATFLVNPALGFLTTLAIAAHEVPQEIADFSILVHGGLGKVRALVFNFISGLTALLGAVVGFYFLEKLEAMLPLLLAFTAGMFIYIASSDLIPELHK